MDSLDLEINEYPMDNMMEDIGISLPNVEDVKMGLLPSQRRAKRWLVMASIIAGAFVVIIIGLSVGLSSGGKAKDSSSTNAVEGGPSISVPSGGGVDLDSELRYNNAFNFIQDIQLSPKEHMQDSDAAQHKALVWISTQDSSTDNIPVNMESPGANKFAQRYILAVLYYALGGSNWEFGNDFLSDYDECDWNRGLSAENNKSFKFGASCSAKGTVSELFMPGNGLSGSIPLEIGFLTDLTHISLFDNKINGELPATMAFLTELDFLAMDSNKLDGSVPQWLDRLSNLQTLALGDNLLNGKLPASMNKMMSLREVALDGNQLSGGVDVFFDLPNLERLYLGDNKLEGTIDDTAFTGTTKLKELDLSSNFLAGSIPLHFFNDHKLQILDLHGNALKGSIPQGITSNTKLTYFSAYENEISSSLPSTIANLKHLTHLDVSVNKLEGSIPTVMSSMTRLTYLFLGRNDFLTAPIPDFMALVNLEELSLKNVQLTGSIPTEIGLLTDLILLDFGENQITGKLPHAMQHLTKLRFLVLNSNKLTGTITVGFKHLESIDMILLDDNDITGGAAHICGADGPTGPAIMSADCCKGDGCTTTELECTCCTFCCANDDDCYDHDDLLANHNLAWFQTGSDYVRDAYVFSEDIVFNTVRGE